MAGTFGLIEASQEVQDNTSYIQGGSLPLEILHIIVSNYIPSRNQVFQVEIHVCEMSIAKCYILAC